MPTFRELKAAIVPTAGKEFDKIKIAYGVVRTSGDALGHRHEF
jgi:hypothetical protein